MPCVEVRRQMSGGRSLLPEWVPGIRLIPEARKRAILVYSLSHPISPFLVFVLSESKMQLFSHFLSDKSCFHHRGQVQLQQDQSQIGEGGWWKSHCGFFSDPRDWSSSVCLQTHSGITSLRQPKARRDWELLLKVVLEKTSLGWHDTLCLCLGHRNPGGTTLTQKQKSTEPWRCVFDKSTSISGETVTSRSIRGPSELQSISHSNVGSCHHPLYSLQGEVQLRIFMNDYQAAEIQHSPNLGISHSWNVWDQLPFTLYHS